MFWVVISIATALIIFLVYKKKSKSGNLGKTINYDQGKGTRKEAFLNHSRSEYKLESIVGHATAERLIVNILLDNPTKSRAWCADKALRDLLRDRRS